jgi:hypothetical protein
MAELPDHNGLNIIPEIHLGEAATESVFPGIAATRLRSQERTPQCAGYTDTGNSTPPEISAGSRSMIKREW